MKSAIVALLFLGLVAAAVGVAVVAPVSYGYYGVPAYSAYSYSYPSYSYGYRTYGYPGYVSYAGYPYAYGLLKK